MSDVLFLSATFKACVQSSEAMAFRGRGGEGWGDGKTGWREGKTRAGSGPGGARDTATESYTDSQVTETNMSFLGSVPTK